MREIGSPVVYAELDANEEEKIRGARRSGFSLVEILVVLVIVSIISGGTMMIAGTGTDRAKFVRAQRDLDTIQQAFLQYYNVIGSYADVTAGALSTAFPSSGTPNRREVFQSFLGKPLENMEDPWSKSGAKREYMVAGSVTSQQQGNIVIYVAHDAAIVSGAGDAFSIGSANTAAATALVDTQSSRDITSPMYRIVYSVNY